jgi:hypothetical protein
MLMVNMVVTVFVLAPINALIPEQLRMLLNLLVVAGEWCRRQDGPLQQSGAPLHKFARGSWQ